MLLEEVSGDDTQQEYKLFLDLDGVMADFIKGVQKLIPNYTEDQYENDPQYQKKMWAAINEYSNSGGELWGDLDLMPDAMVLWDYLSKYGNLEILTATGDPKYGAGAQKRKWVPKHLGGVKINLVRKSKEKAQYAKPNHILIDDMSKSIDPWVQAGGIGILHTSAADTINKLKELGV